MCKPEDAKVVMSVSAVIEKLMDLCYKSYMLCNRSSDESEISFKIEAGTHENSNQAKDNRRLSCSLEGSHQWNVSYDKHEFERLAIFDSTAYKVFEYLTDEYKMIIIEGVYDIKKKDTYVTKIQYIKGDNNTWKKLEICKN